MRGQTANLNSGPVARRLTQVGAPMTIGLLSVLAVGIADAFFLARVSESALAAVGFVYPAIVAVTGFSIGVSAGTNAALSQARGGDETATHLSRLALHGCLFALLAGSVIALAFWAGAPMLFSALGASGDVLDNTLAYTPYWAMSFPMLMATMALETTFRAAGNGVTPSLMMVLAAVVNVVITPVLVFGYGAFDEMGMAGAGLGTLIARTIALVIVALVAFRRGMISAGPRSLTGIVGSIRQIVSVALPAGLSKSINPAGMAIVTAAVATLGDTAVAGFGAAARIQAIALVPFFALAAGLGPVVGQAWGAHDPARGRAAMRCAALFCAVYGAALAVGLLVYADLLARVMTANAAASEYAADYLRLVGWSLGGYGFVAAANAAMTARSRAIWAMGLSLTRIGVIYIPFAWLGVSLLGYDGILMAAVAANIVAMWGALVVSRVTQVGSSDAALIRIPARWLAAVTGAAPLQRQRS